MALKSARERLSTLIRLNLQADQINLYVFIWFFY